MAVIRSCFLSSSLAAFSTLRPRAMGAVLVLLLTTLLAGCAGQSVSTNDGQHMTHSSSKGMAAYYDSRYNGRRTASGERFNVNAMTAAHRTLPFGTRVQVTNLDNGRDVVVRINDRGPFSGGRIIDLSPAAARTLGMLKSGVAPVRLDVLD